ncbi:MAG: hypothetical protein HY207_00780 [Nitrospirae bacterium]|nr:hypothetical protein [Nitrospirota bacterium]
MKVERHAQVLGGLIASLDLRFDGKIRQRLSEAVETQSAELLLRVARELVIYDAIDNLDIAQNQIVLNESFARSRTKIANLDYQLLSPWVQARSIKLDGTIRNLFARANIATPDPRDFQKMIQTIAQHLRDLSPVK